MLLYSPCVQSLTTHTPQHKTQPAIHPPPHPDLLLYHQSHPSHCTQSQCLHFCLLRIQGIGYANQMANSKAIFYLNFSRNITDGQAIGFLFDSFYTKYLNTPFLKRMCKVLRMCTVQILKCITLAYAIP